MTLTTLLVVVVMGLGLWALVFTNHFLNTRHVNPTLVLVARILFIVTLLFLGLVRYGAIRDVSIGA